MEENIDWLFDDPLPCVDMANWEPFLRTEAKCEAGCKEQQQDGTCVKAESIVKEEVQVKMERGDEASVGQSLCLSANADCGACVVKCGRDEANSQGGCAELEEKQYMYKRNADGKWHAVPCVVTERETGTDLWGCDSLGLAEGEQSLEGERVCKQEQAVDGAAGWGRWQVMKMEGGGECESVFGREEEGRRDMGSKGMVQPLISMVDCKVKMKSECCEETGVQRLGDEEKVQEEGGVHAQAQWSDGSSAPVASTSSLEVDEARPCVSSEETTQLSHLRRRHCSPPRQQPCSQKARVQSAGDDGHQEAWAVCGGHSDAGRIPAGLKKLVCSHCNFRCALEGTLKRHVDTVHEGLKKHACPHCQFRAGQKGNLQRHIDTVHERIKNYACPHCQYSAGRRDNLRTHIDTVHEHLKKYACPHCQYRASRNTHLQIHIDRVHKHLKKYACPHCQHKAGQQSNLIKETHRHCS